MFLWLLYILGGIVVTVIFVYGLTLLFGAPYLTTSKEAIATMIALAKGHEGEKMVDLGAGDGRIVIAFAKEGIEAHGYEINPLLVWWGRRTIKNMHLETRAFLHWGNFFREDLSPFDIVVIFGFDTVMPRLERKLAHELKPSARVMSNSFRFPTWRFKHKQSPVFLYTMR